MAPKSILIAILALLIFSYIVVASLGPNGLALTPPMGWSTWCTESGPVPCISDYCDEGEIRQVAKAMVTDGLVKLGYNLILLDDCWGGGRNATTNEIYPDPTRFPSGMANLAAFLHSLGMKLGLYTDVGMVTCRGGRPGSYPFYQQDAKTFGRMIRVIASWGIDYVKMDWCDHPGNYTAQELYTMFSEALMNSGRPMMFGICGWGLYNVQQWAPSISNAWRIGPDHLPLWWTPETNQDPGQGQGTANIIQHMAGLSKNIGPGSWGDPDFLMPGYFWMGESDQITEFSFWALFGAPLVVATDLREIGDKKVILNSEVIAIDQDPLGQVGDLYYNHSDGGQIWSRPLSGNRWAVILYNSNIVYGDVTLVLKFVPALLLGWPTNSTVATVRDVWAHKDLGKLSAVKVELGVHESNMYVVAPSY